MCFEKPLLALVLSVVSLFLHRLAVSSYLKSDFATQLTQIDFDFYLIKPFNNKQLLKILKNILSEYQSLSD